MKFRQQIDGWEVVTSQSVSPIQVIFESDDLEFAKLAPHEMTGSYTFDLQMSKRAASFEADVDGKPRSGSKHRQPRSASSSPARQAPIPLPSVPKIPDHIEQHRATSPLPRQASPEPIIEKKKSSSILKWRRSAKPAPLDEQSLHHRNSTSSNGSSSQYSSPLPSPLPSPSSPSYKDVCRSALKKLRSSKFSSSSASLASSSGTSHGGSSQLNLPLPHSASAEHLSTIPSSPPQGSATIHSPHLSQPSSPAHLHPFSFMEQRSCRTGRKRSASSPDVASLTTPFIQGPPSPLLSSPRIHDYDPKEVKKTVKFARKQLMKEVERAGYNSLAVEGWDLTVMRQGQRYRIEVQYRGRPSLIKGMELGAASVIPRNPPFLKLLEA